VENIAAMIGLIFAFAGVFLTELTGNPRFDALGSLAVGIVLMAVAVFLAGESRALLIGESAAGPLVDEARTAIESQAGVEQVESLRTMHLGPDHVVVTATVRFEPDQDDLPQIISELKKRLLDIDPILDDVTIEPTTR
jgi:divalent metal cation (Fe/Co/Zn/Cd) transporter